MYDTVWHNVTLIYIRNRMNHNHAMSASVEMVGVIDVVFYLGAVVSASVGMLGVAANNFSLYPPLVNTDRWFRASGVCMAGVVCVQTAQALLTASSFSRVTPTK